MAHFLFNSVFTETHPELDSLNTSILALQNTYQSTYSGDIEEDKINLIEEEKEISILADEQLYNIETKKNMLLLATLNALTRKENTIEHKNDKKYLTNEYRFD
ncbi:1688_t:CDS:2, partial [Gigaspora margarita]